MDVNHLKKNELAYEITIRGIEVPSKVEDRRKVVRGILAQEKKGTVTRTIKNDFTFAEDVIGIEESIADIITVLENFLEQGPDSEYRRLVTRLFYLTGSNERLNTTGISKRKNKMI